MAMCGATAVRRTRGWKQAVLAAAGLWLLSGCSAVERFYDSKLTPDTPIGWWHDLQGGVIADRRPPPPGVDDPYPNLSTVPPRPVMTDAAARRALGTRLAAERDRTQRDAAQDPLAPPGPLKPVVPPVKVAPPPAPAPVGAPSGASAEPEPSVAVLEAATAPPPPSAVPSAAASSAARRGRPAPNPSAPPAVSGPLPDLPAGAPAFPVLPGIPATAFAPPVPRALPVTAVAFARGSAAVPALAEAALRTLADRRAGATILVSAGGDAVSTAPEAQASALPLAWRRVRAVGSVLLAAGVPASALREDATATGRAANARLLE